MKITVTEGLIIKIITIFVIFSIFIEIVTCWKLLIQLAMWTCPSWLDIALQTFGLKCKDTNENGPGNVYSPDMAYLLPLHV